MEKHPRRVYTALTNLYHEVDLPTVIALCRSASQKVKVEVERDKLAVELLAAKANISKMRDALIWCGGSGDFAREGAAHTGWCKIVVPLLAESGRDETVAGSEEVERSTFHRGGDEVEIPLEREIELKNSGAEELARILLGDDGVGEMSPGPCADLLTEWRRTRVERDKLVAFKSWCHAYLDERGVPKEFPDGEHSKCGCRIGDRMDWVFRQLKNQAAFGTVITAESEQDKIVAQLAKGKVKCDETEGHIEG